MDDFLTSLSAGFYKVRQDKSSACVGGHLKSLHVEDYDEEAIWQQLCLTSKQYRGKINAWRADADLNIQGFQVEDEKEDDNDVEEEEDEDDEGSSNDNNVKEDDTEFGLDACFEMGEDEEEDDDDEEEEEESNNGEDDEEEEEGEEGDYSDVDDEEGDKDMDTSIGLSARDEDDDAEGEMDLEKMSAHERRQYKLKKEISNLEGQNLAPKSWEMSGEASAPARPENSLLGEHLEVDHVTRGAPEATQEKTKTLEDRIIQRIKDQAWDDVVRREKPVEKPYQYRKTTPLDQEKSKLSLAQVYEKEYIDQRQKDKPKEEAPEIKEIKHKAKLLFANLDALCNYHYTPKGPSDDIKIVTNKPAIEMEEVVPAATSDATLLAPEEVLANKKREVKGATERTDTDRKRERRLKKAGQHRQALKQQKKLKAPGNKKAAAVEHVKKQVKLGKVKLASTETDKALKSSTAFFSRLQDEAVMEAARIKQKKSKA